MKKISIIMAFLLLLSSSVFAQSTSVVCNKAYMEKQRSIPDTGAVGIVTPMYMDYSYLSNASYANPLSVESGFLYSKRIMEAIQKNSIDTYGLDSKKLNVILTTEGAIGIQYRTDSAVWVFEYPMRYTIQAQNPVRILTYTD